MKHQNLAILFPGQGSQEKGMGRDLAEKDSQYMEIWKKAEKICSHSLREIFWDGEPEDMAQTQALQPALTVVNLNLWFYLKNQFNPQAAAGHSLGEFCALCASGVLDLDTTLKLVSLRGKLMSEAGKDSNGAMAAILKLDQDTAKAIAADIAHETGKTILVANFNTPKQFVISGHKDAIKAAEPKVKQCSGRMVVLPVSGAFHSPMMQEAAVELSKFMEKVSWKEPDFPVYFNATAKPENNPHEIKKIMQKQMISPVLFVQLINNLYDFSINSFVELGPKGVLSKMVSQILSPEKDFNTSNIGSLQDESKMGDI
ncbi:ACP S-malonyltransferase [Desulfonatronovibrio magnus]|uniref:ACP S-malonyltransferase n=1 Tax=Desulfonatronovibrio magnus TaxID=698827 RepID=UPI000B296C17|nr:ACP S-malonyltransferase [Desulfonatronovibrio magnus]